MGALMIDNLIQLGTIVNVDSKNRALVCVQLFDRVTDFMPYKMTANSHIRVFTPPQIGEQVIVFFPFANGDSGVALGGIYNANQKEPTSSNEHTSVIEFSDGTLITYDTQNKSLAINASGTIAITAPTGITITANTSISGNVIISGNLSVSGTITDEKGSLTSHVHSGVMAGPSNTGARP